MATKFTPSLNQTDKISYPVNEFLSTLSEAIDKGSAIYYANSDKKYYIGLKMSELTKDIIVFLKIIQIWLKMKM